MDTNERLSKLLSKESGLLGLNSTGIRKIKYEFIGYKLSIDFSSTWQQMNQEQQMNLQRIMTHFDIHARPLRIFLEKIKLHKETKETLDTFFLELAWSHFMTVVMFGILESAVKISPHKIIKDGNMKKLKSIILFLEKNLPISIQNEVVKNYCDESTPPRTFIKFSEVIKHLWEEIRSGFVHELGVQSKGLEWYKFNGKGTKEEPLNIKSDTPMQEWIRIIWQAILNSYGYKGTIDYC